MEKADLTKLHKTAYTAKPLPALVTMEPAHFLAITGQGDPSSPAFAERIQALYTTAYTLKFRCKARGQDFGVAKLEGQWWYDESQFTAGLAATPVEIPRSEWYYRLLIRLPDFVTEADVAEATAIAVTQKQLPLAQEIAWFPLDEGLCVQMLHIGPFSTEPESLHQIQVFCQEKGLLRNGLHHEVYLSDFRKTAPGALKTILREPVKKA